MNVYGLCEYCPPNTYSIRKYESECTNCKPKTICEGGEIISIDLGYWRTHNLSDIVVECYNLKENCLGGPGNTSLELCYEGHIGALCEECDLEA